MKLPQLKHYPLSYATGCIVVLLSVMPFNEMPDLADVPLADKWTHMVMYGGLSFIAWTEHLWRHKTLDIQRAAIFAYIAPVVLGGLMELVQATLPYRSCDVWDFVANTIGATLISIIGLIVGIKREK
ncbi:MAG: VanZ family protein [Bacteroidaceae bacterium]|nr:VanZ family protein [Bacteroidaceae bacterium]